MIYPGAVTREISAEIIENHYRRNRDNGLLFQKTCGGKVRGVLLEAE